jgi:hypothetical protein
MSIRRKPQSASPSARLRHGLRGRSATPLARAPRPRLGSTPRARPAPTPRLHAPRPRGYVSDVRLGRTRIASGPGSHPLTSSQRPSARLDEPQVMAKARSLNSLRTPGGGFSGAGCLVPGYRRSIVCEEAKLSGVGGQTRDRSVEGPATSLVHRKITRLALMLGQAVRDERVRRRLTVREMTAAAGLGRGTVSEPPARPRRATTRSTTTSDHPLDHDERPPARPRRATTRSTEWHDRRMICEATPPRAASANTLVSLSSAQSPSSWQSAPTPPT